MKKTKQIHTDIEIKEETTTTTEEITTAKDTTSTQSVSTAVAVVVPKKKNKTSGTKENSKKSDSAKRKSASSKYDVFKEIAFLLNKTETEIINDCCLYEARKILSVAGKSLVRYSVSEKELEEILLNAKKYNFGEVLVSPDMIEKCYAPVKKHLLTDVTVSTIVGFPFGDDVFKSKLVTLSSCAKLGVDSADVVMKYTAETRKDKKIFKKQLKKIDSHFRGKVGIAVSVKDTDTDKLIALTKAVEKSSVKGLLLMFGECSLEEVGGLISLVSKNMERKELRVMLNVTTIEDVCKIREMGVDRVITPYLDEILGDIKRRFSI